MPTIVKYQIKLWVNDQRIPMKPYVSNTFGNLCIAFLSELKGFDLEKLSKIQIFPQNQPEKLIDLKVGEDSIDLKEFVQVQMWKTLLGFISVLDKVPVSPDELDKAIIKIELLKRKTE
ncbi:hypothetical protein [Candidatus Harpocratesius sp.]